MATEYKLSYPAAQINEKLGKIVDLDTTLTNRGEAADAKAVGDAIGRKVDKVDGKGLSSNDYNNAAKAKVDAIPDDPKYTDTVYDDTEVKQGLNQVKDDLADIQGKIFKTENGVNYLKISSDNVNLITKRIDSNSTIKSIICDANYIIRLISYKLSDGSTVGWLRKVGDDYVFGSTGSIATFKTLNVKRFVEKYPEYYFFAYIKKDDGSNISEEDKEKISIILLNNDTLYSKQNELTFSDRFAVVNDNVSLVNGIIPPYSLANEYLKELYIPNLEEKITRIELMNSAFSSSTNEYIFFIRLYFSDGTYVNTVYFSYYSQEECINAANYLNDKIVEFYDEYHNVYGYIVYNVSNIALNYRREISLEYCNVNDVARSPKILSYLFNKRENQQTSEKVLSEALSNSIGADYSYQAKDQFKKDSLVKVYADGLLVNPNKYVLYKQGKIIFKEPVSYNNDSVLFEYEKFVKDGKSLENNLSENLYGMNKVIEEQYSDLVDSIFSFVNNPTNPSEKVLCIKCTEVRETSTSKKFRGQLDVYDVNATEIHQSLKIYIPDSMLNALRTFPKNQYYWNSFTGGAWCPFGNLLSANKDYFSGSAVSVGFNKISNDDQVKYYIQAKQKFFNPDTKKEYDGNLDIFYTEFIVKSNEWITVNLDVSVGNPGYIKFTVIDSDGEHIFETNEAHVGVADPENEENRYGDKVISDIPYRKFTTIGPIKFYCSNELAQHLITNGVCELYFKDYKLTSKNVNAF